MNRKEILKKIEAGKYKIEYNEDCGCHIDWVVTSQGLEMDIDSDSCYQSNTLIVDGKDIIEYIRYEGANEYAGISLRELPPEVEYELRLGMWECLGRGETGSSEKHDKNVRNSLVAFLMEGEYELDRDDCRGFANEYTMILRKMPDGKKADIRQEEAEAWADDYLYKGDAATEAFVGFRLEDFEQ